MRHIISWTACCVSMFAAGAVAPARAQSNEQTDVTIHQAVELPGITLQPGAYEFKLLDSPANRHIVQVFEKGTGKVLATLLAVPAERTRPADETIVAFAEAPADAPQPIRYWYYPGRTVGHEFVYPREQATRIAQATGQRVLSAETASADSMKSARVSTVEPPKRAAAAAVRPVDERAAGDRVSKGTGRERSAPATPDAVTRATPDVAAELPQTGSTTPLVGLVGLAALAAAVALRARLT